MKKDDKFYYEINREQLLHDKTRAWEKEVVSSAEFLVNCKGTYHSSLYFKHLSEVIKNKPQ